MRITIRCNHCGRMISATPEEAEANGWLLCDVRKYYAAGYCWECQEGEDADES